MTEQQEKETDRNRWKIKSQYFLPYIHDEWTADSTQTRIIHWPCGAALQFDNRISPHRRRLPFY